MAETFVQSSAAREQEWEGAGDSGDWDLANKISADRMRQLNAVSLEDIKVASAAGVDVTSDALRMYDELESKVFESNRTGKPIDQSIFTDMEFLDELIADAGL